MWSFFFLDLLLYLWLEWSVGLDIWGLWLRQRLLASTTYQQGFLRCYGVTGSCSNWCGVIKPCHNRPHLLLHHPLTSWHIADIPGLVLGKAKRLYRLVSERFVIRWEISSATDRQDVSCHTIACILIWLPFFTLFTLPMARPKKHNAEYFSHDSSMRNDEKILAVRRVFGLWGYALWNMMLEKLCDQNHWKLPYSNDLDKELLAGDFMVDTSLLDEFVEYCMKLWLLICEDGLLYSQTLIERFGALVDKRKYMQNLAKSKWGKKGNKKKEKTTSEEATAPDEAVSQESWAPTSATYEWETASRWSPWTWLGRRKTMITAQNKDEAQRIYEVIKRYNQGVVDGTLEDCAYLLRKIRKIDDLKHAPHELLDMLLQATIQSDLHTYFSISNPRKICHKLGDMMNRAKKKLQKQSSQVLVV